MGVAADGVTFFVGSLLFTAAACLLCLQVTNAAGAIAFGASAVASHVVPASDQPRNVTLMNLGTFIGALCFLVGAVLLLPERSRDDARRTPQ